MSCKVSPKETICVIIQSLFPRENKKNIMNLSSSELAQRVVKVKVSRVKVRNVVCRIHGFRL